MTRRRDEDRAMVGALSTKQQFLLSKFLNSLNEDWDIPGIEHALGQARGMAAGPDLACAAIRAAVTVGNRTPAVIALPGPHWRAQSGPIREPRVEAGERCSTCSHSKAMCRALYDDFDHRYTPTSEVLRAVRALSEERTKAIADETRARIQATQIRYVAPEEDNDGAE